MDSELTSRGKVENTNFRIEPWYLLDSGGFHRVQFSMKWQFLLVKTRLMNYIGI